MLHVKSLAERWTTFFMECFLIIYMTNLIFTTMNKLKLFKLAGTVAMAVKEGDTLSYKEKAKAFIRMIKDTISGRYKPKKRNIVLGSLVIAYVLSPIDLIPGFLLDDAAIVLIAIKFFTKEIDRYLDWEKDHKYQTIDTDAKIVEE